MKSTIHSIKRWYYLNRFGVDIDIDYEPPTDKEVLKHYEDCRKALVDAKDFVESLKLEAKANPIRAPFIYADRLPCAYKSESNYQELCDYWMEDIKERGLSVD